MHEGSCAREDSFTVVFYGSKTFYRKTAQFGENVARISLLRGRSEKQTAQRRENPRKNTLLNYESAALPAELRRRIWPSENSR
jgi:hypothetical protein